MHRTDARMIYTGMTEAFFTYVKVAFWGGAFITFPFVATQLWLFIAPGLYRNEKEALLPFLAATPILFFAGGAFVYYFVFPWPGASSWASRSRHGSGRTAHSARSPRRRVSRPGDEADLRLRHRLPAAGRTDAARARRHCLTADQLASGRRYAIVICSSSAAVLTPPDVISQIGLAMPMLLLYEISIFLVRGVMEKTRARQCGGRGRGRARPTRQDRREQGMSPVIDLRWLRDKAGVRSRRWPVVAIRPPPPPCSRSTPSGASSRPGCRRIRPPATGCRARSARARKGRSRPAEILAEMTALKERVKQGEETLRELQGRLDELVAGFPNMLADDVPDGPDERDNVEVRRWGEPRSVRLRPLAARRARRGARAWTSSARRGCRARGSSCCGASSPAGARARPVHARPADRASTATPRSPPPLLVRDEALFGTGQLPKFAEDLFRTTTGHWLIPTAEVPLTNLVARRDPGRGRSCRCG